MKRLLTEHEIEGLLDFIRPCEHIPTDTAQSIVDAHKRRLHKQLVDLPMYPEVVPQLKAELERHFQESLIQAGESVGIICSQSIGEQQTQSTLNSFHHSGISSAITTKGIPRFEELLNATKNPKIVNHTVYFVPDISGSIQSLREHLGCSIRGFTLGDLALSMDVCMEKEAEPWYPLHAELYGAIPDSAGPDCIRIRLDPKKLYDYSISIDLVAQVLQETYTDLHCVCSPPTLAQIDLYLETERINMEDERLLYVTQSNKIQVYLQEVALPLLRELLICGIHGIEDTFFRKAEGSTGPTRWIMDTSSRIPKATTQNAYSALLGHPLVDYRRTLSNNVWDIYNTLDIEAAREFLIQEFTSIMKEINLCHSMLLVDRMTYYGSIASINRYTLKREETSPLSRSSFEETLENLLNAATKAEVDHTRGVSASIICGKRANIGTGMSTVVPDMDALLEINEEEVEDDEEETAGFF